MLKKRYLTSFVVEDLKSKMVFISGPRQVGKTTLSTELLTSYYKESATTIGTLKRIGKRCWHLNGQQMPH